MKGQDNIKKGDEEETTGYTFSFNIAFYPEQVKNIFNLHKSESFCSLAEEQINEVKEINIELRTKNFNDKKSPLESFGEYTMDEFNKELKNLSISQDKKDFCLSGSSTLEDLDEVIEKYEIFGKEIKGKTTCSISNFCRIV